MNLQRKYPLQLTYQIYNVTTSAGSVAGDRAPAAHACSVVTNSRVSRVRVAEEKFPYIARSGSEYSLIRLIYITLFCISDANLKHKPFLSIKITRVPISISFI